VTGREADRRGEGGRREGRGEEREREREFGYFCKWIYMKDSNFIM
jgi:hypothetical protein